MYTDKQIQGLQPENFDFSAFDWKAAQRTLDENIDAHRKDGGGDERTRRDLHFTLSLNRIALRRERFFERLDDSGDASYHCDPVIVIGDGSQRCIEVRSTEVPMDPARIQRVIRLFRVVEDQAEAA